MKLKFALFFVLALASCKSKSTQDPIKNPPPPRPKTVQVEVRPDIQLYIDSLKTDPVTAAAMKQYARSFQALLKASNKDEAVIAGKSIVEAVQCLFYVSPAEASQLSRELEVRLLNSEELVRSYSLANRLLGGTSFPHRSLDDRANACVKEPI